MKKSQIILINCVTLSRVVALIPVFFITNLDYLFVVAVWAGLSDFLDGFLARKWGLTTNFGVKLDQYADKIASLLLLLFFIQNQQLSWLFVTLIISRELAMVIFRKLNWANIQSNFLGKAKTFLLYLLFIYLSAEHLIYQTSIEFKMVLMILSIGCSWFSFLLSIPNLSSQLIYAFGTTGLSSILIKKASGTITSIVVFLLLFFGLNSIGLEYKIGLLLFLLIIHFTYYNLFLKQINSLNDDPSIYTLDETLAITLAWLYVGELSIIEVIILFVLFRFFDILKPLGIRKIEKQLKWTAATRNVADDILAMVYALLIFQMVKIYVE